MVSNRDTNKIIGLIGEIETMADLNLVISAINRRGKQLRSRATREAKRLYNIGDAIFIRTPAGLEECTLLEIRRTKAVIRCEDGLKYTCRLSQIERRVA